MRSYLLSAQNTLFPVATSFLILPFLIRLAGIEVWLAITIGQGVGLLLAEIVQGSWNQLAPKIGLTSSIKLHHLYSSSLRERKSRFVLCGIIGSLIIPLVCDENLVIAEISFFTWLMNGLNAHWITTGTGNGSLTFRFFTIPRTIATFLGMSLAYLLDTIFVYLALLLLTNIFSIISLKMAFREKSTKDFLKEYIDRKQHLTNILSNLVAAGNSWLLLLLVNFLFDNGDLEISIQIRYSEFAYALMLIIPQINHAAFFAKSKSPGKLLLVNITQAIIIGTIFTVLFPIVNRHIFGSASRQGYLLCFSFLCIAFLRSVISLYVQDFLIIQKRFYKILRLQLLVSCSFLISSVLVKVADYDWQTLPFLVIGFISLAFLPSLNGDKKFFLRVQERTHLD